MSSGIKNLIIVTIIVMIGAFYVSTIRQGHDWGGDFSMYIQHAKNIAEGIDYKDTKYLYNPFYPGCGPKTYPPVFPLMLSGVYKVFGLNLTAMKVEVIFAFLIFLFIFYLVIKNDFSFYHSAVILSAIGLNPFFWNFKDNVLSDLPFLLFVYLVLFLIYRAPKNHKSAVSSAVYGILAGFLVYLCSGTRAMGFMLIFLLIYDAVKLKRPLPYSIIASFVFLFLTVLQTIFLHSDAGYFRELSRFNIINVLHNISLYGSTLSLLLDNGCSKVLRYVLFSVFSLMAVFGYIAKVRYRTTVFEIFTVGYMVFLTLWPQYQGMRYLIPIIPMYFYYIFYGCAHIYLPRRLTRGIVLAGFIGILFVSYIVKYTRLDYGPIKEGVEKKETQELFGYIKTNTGDRDIFIFQKPRVLGLYTNRYASIYHSPVDYNDLWQYLYQIKATYVIVGKPFDRDRTYLYDFVRKYRSRFKQVFSNQDFALYRIGI